MNHLKIFVGLILFTLASASAQASWLEIENCQVQSIQYGFWFAGNTGNYNLNNMELVEVSLKNCAEGKNRTLWISANHPNLGIVKNPYPALSSSSVQNSLQMLKEAYAGKKKIKIKGEDYSGIMVPVVIQLGI